MFSYIYIHIHENINRYIYISFSEGKETMHMGFMIQKKEQCCGSIQNPKWGA